MLGPQSYLPTVSCSQRRHCQSPWSWALTAHHTTTGYIKTSFCLFVCSFLWEGGRGLWCESGSHHVALTGLELTVWTRLVSIPLLPLLRTGVKEEHRYIRAEPLCKAPWMAQLRTAASESGHLCVSGNSGVGLGCARLPVHPPPSPCLKSPALGQELPGTKGPA